MRPVTHFTLFGIRLGIVVLVVYWVAIFVGTHLPAVLDFSPQVSDKLKHFAAYFGLAGLLCYVTNSSQSYVRFAIIVSVCVCYAALDEITQTLVAGRVADVYDFLADTAGAASATAFYVVLRTMLPRPSKPTHPA